MELVSRPPFTLLVMMLHVSATNLLQICTGHASGSETAVHAMQNVIHTVDCEAALLVDASNASNSISDKTAIHNVSIFCPALSTVLHNTTYCCCSIICCW